MRAAQGRVTTRVPSRDQHGCRPGAPVPEYHRGAGTLFSDMRTFPHRRTARRSHHPAVTCDVLGRWQWQCACGAGARGGAASTDWHWMVTAALVHQNACPGE